MGLLYGTHLGYPHMGLPIWDPCGTRLHSHMGSPYGTHIGMFAGSFGLIRTCISEPYAFNVTDPFKPVHANGRKDFDDIFKFRSNTACYLLVYLFNTFAAKHLKTNTSVPSLFQGLLNIEGICVQHREYLKNHSTYN